ncbi:MAG: hypothetical protein KY475_01100 [Planctomycetes bacterium]|nr:hypothetical protein [Planctomycetota bacterium]
MKRIRIPEFLRRVTPWGDGLRIELSYIEGEEPTLPPQKERKVAPLRLVAKMIQAIVGRKI